MECKGLNKQGMSVWIGRGGGSSAVTIVFGDASAVNNAS